MQIRRTRRARTTGILGLASAIVSSFSFAAAPAATVQDLAWMTGNYAGALGPTQLEENWIKAEGGSIAAIVRSTIDNTSNMFEMITIEEVGGSLILHIQQFNAGFEPRTPTPQKMELKEIAPNHVRFQAVGEGGMRSLGYTKLGDSFTIHVESGDRPMSNIELKSRSLWQ